MNDLQSWGYVYLKTHPNAQGLHKIGITRHPAARKEQLGGDDCVVIARIMALDPEGLERKLHFQFSEQRLPQSEWFNLNNDDIRQVCDALSEAHEKAMHFVVLPRHQASDKKPEYRYQWCVELNQFLPPPQGRTEALASYMERTTEKEREALRKVRNMRADAKKRSSR